MLAHAPERTGLDRIQVLGWFSEVGICTGSAHLIVTLHDSKQCISQNLQLCRQFLQRITAVAVDQKREYALRLFYSTRNIFLHGSSSNHATDEFIRRPVFMIAVIDRTVPSFGTVRMICIRVASVERTLELQDVAHVYKACVLVGETFSFHVDIQERLFIHQAGVKIVHHLGMAQVPRVFPDLHEGEISELYSQLLDGRRDVIFAPRNEEVKDHLYFNLYTARPVCILLKDHPLASRSLITVKDISSLLLFLSHQVKGFPTLRSVWHYVETNHEMGSIIYVDTVPVIYEYVRAGMGISVVPPLSRQAENHLAMVPFDYPHPHYYGVHCLKENEEAIRFCQIAERLAKDTGKVLL